MNTIWGITLIVTSGLAVVGQFISAFWPASAAQLGLSESEDEVDTTFYADARGEAYWDTATLWTLPVAGVLMLLDNHWWIPFGLIGGGAYLYFAGRGLAVRIVMQRRSIGIGSRRSVTTGMIFLAVWGLVALVTILAAVRAMST